MSVKDDPCTWKENIVVVTWVHEHVVSVVYLELRVELITVLS